MKDQRMAELFKELGNLTQSDAPKEQIIAKALEVKLYIQDFRDELARAMNLLDSTVLMYAPNKDWQLGLPLDKGKLTSSASSRLASTTALSSKSNATKTSPEHILEVANRLFPKGIVENERIIAELKHEGDTRPDRYIGRSVGNTLNRNGYKRIGLGKYELVKR